jgi:DNA processing protein
VLDAREQAIPGLRKLWVNQSFPERVPAGAGCFSTACRHAWLRHCFAAAVGGPAFCAEQSAALCFLDCEPRDAGIFGREPFMEGDGIAGNVRYWLALLRISAACYLPFFRLPGHLQDPVALLTAAPKVLHAAGLSGTVIGRIRSPDWDGVQADLDWLTRDGNFLVRHNERAFPQLLRQIPDAPPALLVRGNPEVLCRPQLAMVGSRSPTPGGRRIARRLAREAVEAGLVVTSGLARGIDTESHCGALDTAGITIAVIGSGPDTVYPRSNQGLAGRICGSGAIVSEFPVGTPPLAPNFPRRNRIISGLSLGTLVVEAASASGSLITARHAANQGREVFAVPGNVSNPLARGCHALIRQGAKLVEEMDDIVEEMPPVLVRASPQRACEMQRAPEIKDLDGDAKLLLDNIGYEPVSIDHLIELTGIPVRLAASILTNLEIAGVIDSLPGGNYARR